MYVLASSRLTLCGPCLAASLMERVKQELRGGRGFPDFRDINGLHAALTMRYGDVTNARNKLLRKLKVCWLPPLITTAIKF